MKIKINEAELSDFHAITDIYNSIIEEGGFTADLVPFSYREREPWFKSLLKNKYIYTVNSDNKTIGYFYFSPWRSGREALKYTAEISFYLAKDYRAKGIGSKTLQASIEQAQKKNLKFLIAILLDINTASKALLEKFGFSVAGHLPQIANLKNTKCGQYIMLKHLD